MKKLSKCAVGGGSDCKRHGGTGHTHHASDYVHPFRAASEVGEFIGGYTVHTPVSKSCFSSPVFSEFFDDEAASTFLSHAMDPAVSSSSLAKSLYGFDLSDEENILKILEILPVMDPSLVGRLAATIWPGYTPEEPDPELLRLEVRGYLIGVLEEYGSGS